MSKNFLGIDVAGGPNLSPEGQLLLQDGSAAAPAGAFLSDPTTGFYKSGTAIQTSIAGSSVSTQSASSLALAGALTTGGSIGASGSMTCGTNSLHCGPLTSGTGLLVTGIYGFPNPPTIAFTGNTGSGFYDDGGSSIGIAVGSSRVASWSSTGLNLLAHQLNVGPVVCSSSISAGAITASGVVQVPVGTSTAPSLIFGSDTTTGIFHGAAVTTSFACNSAEVLKIGASQIQAFAPISTGTNTISCGAHTCSALTSSSFTNTGTFSNTSAMTCGAMSCSSLSSTGNVTQPRYTATNYLYNSTQAISGSTTTQIVYPTATDTLTNWTRASTDGYAVPVAGVYSACASVYCPSVPNLNVLFTFWTKNDNSPGTSSIYYGQDRLCTPNVNIDFSLPITAIIPCSAGDILRVWLWAGTGFTIGSTTDTSKASSLQIDRLHE